MSPLPFVGSWPPCVMDKALGNRRPGLRRNLAVLLFVASATLVATIGIAPFVFLIWMVTTVARWLGFFIGF